MLLAVVGATLAVGLLDLTERGVAVVGAVPEGVPRPVAPDVSPHDTGSLLVAAVALAFITIADSIALSRAFAPADEPVRPNQEIAAIGAANVAAGVFQGFPIGASSSRTAVALSSGARSQLAGTVGAIGIVVLLVTAHDTTRYLPSATLAAVVVAASIDLFDAREPLRLLRVRRSEFVLSVLTFAAVILAGVLRGIAIAAALSLANFVRRAWRPYNVALGRIDGRKGYHDVERHPEARQIPGLVLFRFDAPLFFANADYFCRRVHELVARRERQGERIRRVVVAAEPISDIDTTAAEMLARLVDDLERAGIDLTFAELKGPVKDRLARDGLAAEIGRHGFPPTLGTAIADYLETTGVEWVDWEDRSRPR